jgi:hypothetical protein
MSFRTAFRREESVVDRIIDAVGKEQIPPFFGMTS